MAQDFKNLTHRDGRDNEQKTKSKVRLSLSETAKESIQAKERLAIDDRYEGNGNARVEHILYEYQKRQDQLFDNLEKVVADIRVIKKEMSDIESFAQQLVINGVGQAHKKAETITISHLEKAQEKYVTYIQTLVEQAQKRTERLRKSMGKNNFIHITTWLISLLNLVLLIDILLT